MYLYLSDIKIWKFRHKWKFGSGLVKNRHTDITRIELYKRTKFERFNFCTPLRLHHTCIGVVRVVVTSDASEEQKTNNYLALFS